MSQLDRNSVCNKWLCIWSIQNTVFSINDWIPFMCYFIYNIQERSLCSQVMNLSSGLCYFTYHTHRASRTVVYFALSSPVFNPMSSQIRMIQVYTNPTFKWDVTANNQWEYCIWRAYEMDQSEIEKNDFLSNQPIRASHLNRAKTLPTFHWTRVSEGWNLNAE